jgi:hypothetical protein
MAAAEAAWLDGHAHGCCSRCACAEITQASATLRAIQFRAPYQRRDEQLIFFLPLHGTPNGMKLGTGAKRSYYSLAAGR